MKPRTFPVLIKPHYKIHSTGFWRYKHSYSLDNQGLESHIRSALPGTLIQARGFLLVASNGGAFVLHFSGVRQ